MLFSLTFRGFHQVPLCLLRQALRGQSIHPQWPALTDRRVSGYTHEGALQRYPAHIIINIHVATRILSSQTQPSSAVCWVCLPCHLPSLSLRLSSAIQIDMIAFKQPRYAAVTDTHTRLSARPDSRGSMMDCLVQLLLSPGQRSHLRLRAAHTEAQDERLSKSKLKLKKKIRGCFYTKAIIKSKAYYMVL